MLAIINTPLKRIGHLMCLLFCSLLICSTVFAGWDTVVFRDDFNTGVGTNNMPDPSVWVTNHPESWWWVQGRTFFPSPIYHPDGPFPRVENGICTIEHHTYNPYDLSPTPWTFLGGEIHTIMEFEPTSAYRFEARVRCNHYPNGLVTSFFTYGYDGENSDEIDFEFVSNKTNDDVHYPNGDPVLTNIWNESQQWWDYKIDGNLNDWNTFRIYWYPGERVEWTWLDPLNGEVLLRSETDLSRIPDEPMALFFNFWAPNDLWPDAYDENLQPASNANQNEIFSYEIDYAEVRTPEPTTLILLGLGSLFLRRNRKLK
jgi:hypothetical protein